MDKNVSVTMNVFLIIANIINLIYNIPQVVKTYKLKSTKEFSSWFLFLRVVGNMIWIGYAVEVGSLLMLINNIVTVLASMFIGYYKVIEIYYEFKNNKYHLFNHTNHIEDLNNSNNLENTNNLYDDELCDLNNIKIHNNIIPVETVETVEIIIK